MSGNADNPVSANNNAGEVLLRRISLRHGSLWIAAVFALTGAVFAWQALLVDFGTLALPGPGFVPLILAIATVVLAGLIGLQEWQQPDSRETIELGHRDVLVTFAAMLAVPPLFEPLGADVTLGLFGAVLLVFVARTSLVIAAIAAVAGMAASWCFFEVALGLQLPAGWVWDRIWDWFTQVNG
jgi:hypothetical protein